MRATAFGNARPVSRKTRRVTDSGPTIRQITSAMAGGDSDAIARFYRDSFDRMFRQREGWDSCEDDDALGAMWAEHRGNEPEDRVHEILASR